MLVLLLTLNLVPLLLSICCYVLLLLNLHLVPLQYIRSIHILVLLLQLNLVPLFLSIFCPAATLVTSPGPLILTVSIYSYSC